MTETINVANIDKVHKNPIAELVQTACPSRSPIMAERVVNTFWNLFPKELPRFVWTDSLSGLLKIWAN